MQRRAAKEESGHTCNVKAADLGNHIHDIIFIRLVLLDRRLDRVNLPFHTFGGQSGSLSGHFLRAFFKEYGSDRTARRRISDAHLSRRQDIISLLLFLTGQHDSGLQRLYCLVSGHRRFYCHIFCPACHLTVAHAAVRHHSDIDRTDVCAGLTAEDRRSRIVLQKIFSYDFRNLLSGLRHTLGYDAIVRAKYDQCLFVKLYPRRTGHTGNPCNGLLQSSKAAQRHRDRIPVLPCLCNGTLGCRGDLVQCFI